MNENQTAIVAELHNADAWDMIHYALWSQEGEQDDLHWFHVPGNHESLFTYELDLSDYSRAGVYFAHAYGSMKGEDEMTFLGEAKIYVGKE